MRTARQVAAVTAPRHPDAVVLRLALALLFSAPVALAVGPENGHVTVPTPGGMPAIPFITSFKLVGTNLIVTWQDYSGPYRLLQKQSLDDPQWQVVAGPQNSNAATVPAKLSQGFFRVAGPAPQFIGARACEECHYGIHATEMDTAHSHALQTLKRAGMGNNPSCLPCHTVGYGLPTGFINEAATPHLANVQCENCHGPAAAHAANENDFSLRPPVEIAGQLCGGCHTGEHHPNYDEWLGSGHGTVTEPNMNANSCGRCHIGSARLALLDGLPTTGVDTQMPVVCVTCHDPHARHVWTNLVTKTFYTNQLINPLSSTNDFVLTTSDNFTNVYDPNVNICGQCHNHRGANWTSTGRAPHHSPQYNMLLGTVGLGPTGSAPTNAAGHAGTRFYTNTAQQVVAVTNQCVTCHMSKSPYQAGPPAVAAMTGHSFEVQKFDSCLVCHPVEPQLLVQLTTNYFSTRIETIKTMLDMWAMTKAPPQLWTNYGTRSWEFTIPGDLSPGGSGPTTAQQNSLVPTNIWKARFNLYLVLYDGSYGVHNKPHSETLLNNAQAWVQQELDK